MRGIIIDQHRVTTTDQIAFPAIKMDLENSLNNITLDDNPWRQQDPPQQMGHDQQQFQVWGGGMQPNSVSQQPWGHLSPQQQMRNLWQPSNMGQGLNDAMGMSNPASSQGWGGPMPDHEYDQQKIWADPLESHYNQVHPHSRNMNGMIGDPSAAEWSNGGQGAQQIWGNSMNKEPGHYWKQQQQTWGGPPAAPMSGGWPPRQMGHPNGPPPQHGGGPRGGPMMQHQGGWQQNGMMRQNKPMSWGEQPRMQGMSQRGGRPQVGGGGGGRYPNPNMGSVDVSVPPPVDMPHIGQQMRMRPGPPPGGMGGNNPWEDRRLPPAPHAAFPIMGPDEPYANNGMKDSSQHVGSYQNQGHDDMNLWDMKEPPPHVASFPISGPDDLMWHDPNVDLKKWQRDTGVSNWGDPDKNNERPIRMWLVPDGEEEDLETALMKCPVPQKKSEDGTSRLPFPTPANRPIVVTGWGELPENDPNNPTKSEDVNKWSDVTTSSNDTPWYLPGQQSSNQFASNENTGNWVQGGTIPLTDPGSGNNTQAIAEMLKYAVEKGFLDMNIMGQPSLPPTVLNHMNLMLSKIPALESVEAELKQLVESVRPESEPATNSPQRWMNDVQKVEYNRLIIEVTTAKIEVTELSKKIQRALNEAGIVTVSHNDNQNNVATSSQDYHYSFLE
ncbi:unnamed protein product [Caenorhabditis auriculariae]|uniref:Uncharacterized protein n=1 Tax=Caenorhabditis auriculariae TaxID=2777116 RepID=A0A8S1GR62_9PELO|nr:unnamed protein product [Caenorhabditis auriculariae]